MRVVALLASGLLMVASCGRDSTPLPAQGDPAGSAGEQLDFTPPCPEPAGGWVIRDPATATQSRYDQAFSYANAQAEYAGAWVGWVTKDAMTGNTIDGLHQVRASVFTAAFTRDVDRHREKIESLYGGAVCVFEREKTVAELRKLAEEVAALLERRGLQVTSYGADETRGTAFVGVAALPAGLVEELRSTHGSFVEVRKEAPFRF